MRGQLDKAKADHTAELRQHFKDMMDVHKTHADAVHNATVDSYERATQMWQAKHDQLVTETQLVRGEMAKWQE